MGLSNLLPKRWLSFSLLVVILLLIGLTLVNIWMSLSKYSWGSHHTAGAWCALACDIQQGVFYRPLEGTLGYGGTRYFPLYPIIHAALGLISGLNLYLSGVVLSLFSTLLTLAGAARLIILLGRVRPFVAVVASLAILCGQGVQECLAFPRADLLACGLNLWGLVFCAHEAPSRGRLAGAALLFTLAFAAKFTVVFGLVAGVWTLLWNRNLRGASWLAGLGIVGMILTLVFSQVLSQGNFGAVFTDVAAGGLKWHDLPLAPGRFLYKMSTLDPGTFILVFLGLAGCLWRVSISKVNDLAAWTFIFSLIIIGMLFADPIIEHNHFVDLTALAVVSLTVLLGSAEPYKQRLALCLIVSLLVICLPLISQRLWWKGQNNFRTAVYEIENMANNLPVGNRSILATNALIPVLCGQQPFLTDYFMFSKQIQKKPARQEALLKAISKRKFGLVVLYDRCAKQQGKQKLDTFLGKDFCAKLTTYYQHTRTVAQKYWVYAPKPVI
jgi:hypothetical protein